MVSKIVTDYCVMLHDLSRSIQCQLGRLDLLFPLTMTAVTPLIGLDTDVFVVAPTVMAPTKRKSGGGGGGAGSGKTPKKSPSSTADSSKLLACPHAAQLTDWCLPRVRQLLL